MAKRTVIEMAGLSHGVPIPNGAKIGNLVFSSAISGKNPETGKVPENPDEQAEQLFKNIQKFMELAGGAPENIGHMTVYLADEKQRDSINKAWLKMFPDAHNRPARHALK
ncbi:MAG TPA: RidA family protein, partial [Candidatus Binatia bacterium]